LHCRNKKCFVRVSCTNINKIHNMSQNLPEAIQILRNLLEEAQSNISVIGIVKKEIPDKRINTLMGSYLQLSRELDTMIYALKHDLT